MKRTIIGIVGGTGGMGRWFERVFSGIGYKVLIAGRRTEMNYSDLARKSHIVILSVPIEAAVNIAEEIGPLMSADQLLMDFCSLKEDIMKSMLRVTPAQVLGTHPLFGPTTASLNEQNIVFCKGRGDQWSERLKKDFTENGAVVTHMDPIVHDRQMAVVQGLTHFISVCMGRTLQKMDLSPDEALLYSTPVFRLKLDLMGRLFAQDLDLYRDLIGQNRHVRSVVETFSAAMAESGNLLINSSPVTGIEFMEKIKAFLGAYSRKGFEESNIILDALYSKKKRR